MQVQVIYTPIFRGGVALRDPVYTLQGSLVDLYSIVFRGFDYGVSEYSICFFPDEKRAFSEMNRVMRLGGRVIVTDVTLVRDIPKELRNTPTLFMHCRSRGS